MSTNANDPNEATIPLDQFLKRQGAVGSGGQAKLLIQGGEVRVNGKVETRRGCKLRAGDVVVVGGETLIVEPGGDSGPSGRTDRKIV